MSAGLDTAGHLTRTDAATKRVGDLFAELGYASIAEIEAAARTARVSGKRTGEVLLESGIVSSKQLGHVVAQRDGVTFLDLESFAVDFDAARLIDATQLERYCAVPVAYIDDTTLLVAVSESTNVVALDEIALRTGTQIRPAIADTQEIDALIEKLKRPQFTVVADVEQCEETISVLRESAHQTPVVKLVDAIITDAAVRGASDIHFEPGEREMKVRLRIDGVATDATVIPSGLARGVVSRLKIMAELNIAEHRMPQDGRMTVNFDGRKIDARVVTLPTVDGESLVLRLLDHSVTGGLDELGMAEYELERFERAIRQPHGTVLTTGPTGSGKSTTLYAALNEINDPHKSIVTIEDPVEYRMSGVKQIQVQNSHGLTFATGLRSIMRADPDIIMVGEIRDAETARISIEGALTGHLLLSTLHTNDAPSAIARLVDMGIEPFLVASAIHCVAAQRLVRKLCQHCKRPTVVTLDALRANGFNATDRLECFEPVGCRRCDNLGYRGRTAIYEVMEVTDEMRGQIMQRASAFELTKTAIAGGMRTLRENGLRQVAAGVTSISEIARVTGAESR